jgi:Mce-associated membrane protein
VGIPDEEVAVPSFRRRASSTDTDRAEAASPPPDLPAADALTLAEEAEAEAAEAEAIAAAAHARAKALRLRREAQEAEATGTIGSAESTVAADTADADAETADDPSDSAVAEGADVKPVEDEAAPTGRRWALVVKVVAMTLAVLCTIALLAASGWLIIQHRKDTDRQNMNAEYLAAGRQSVVTLMSLDFNKAQDDVNRIIENSTGQFKTDFQNQAEDFVNVAKESKVLTDVNVTAAAVESMTPTSAVVLVAATSRVTNAAGAKQEPRAWRLAVNLERVDGGQVKMSKVEFVP